MTRRKKYKLEDLLAQYRAGGLELTEEKQVWDQMAPVGREFGSHDYERLMDEDAKAQEPTPGLSTASPPAK